MIPTEILDRYDDLLARYCDRSEPEPEPGTSYSHLRWMILQLRHMDDELKAMRWLGFIQGCMVKSLLIDVTTERDFTRPFFKRDTR